MSTYVIDVDNTICQTDESLPYDNLLTIRPVIDKINHLYSCGHEIILFTARGMRSYMGDIELINLNVRPVLEDWLHKNGVLYSRLVMGKPWGPSVIYVDDRSVRPDEFILNKENELINKEWHKQKS